MKKKNAEKQKEDAYAYVEEQANNANMLRTCITNSSCVEERRKQ